MIDLYNELSDLDKKRIENYLSKWGSPREMISVPEYLEYWNKNKQKLYKLLGNQMIYSCPFSYDKPQAQISHEISTGLNQTGHPFYEFAMYFRHFLRYAQRETINKKLLSNEAYDIIYDCLYIESLSNNTFPRNLKEKGYNKKSELRLQKGGKLMKALQKILYYYEDEIKYWQTYVLKEDPNTDLFKLFEDFRIAHSMIFNDKHILGTLNFSIHPLDFITMSDNNSNWSSCMNWQDGGCYRAGTVEMLNSNLVICCYLTRKGEMHFNHLHCEGYSSEDEASEEVDESWAWNDKKWRQLVYVNKDIIVGGKSYPYENDAIAKKIIEVVKDLAKKNLGWNYTFGPELYKDMLHLNSGYAIERALSYRSYNPRKKNIIFHTKAMYNDFICDYPQLHYWCYRNKVKKTTVITTSGPSKCLCCGGPLLEENDYTEGYDPVDEYHDRYLDTNYVVCHRCADRYYTCDSCCNTNFADDLIKVTLYNGRIINMCSSCASYLVYCPVCNSLYKSERWRNDQYLMLDHSLRDIKEVFKYLVGDIRYKDPWLDNQPHAKFLCACPKCSEKLTKEFVEVKSLEGQLEEPIKETCLKQGYYLWHLDDIYIKENVDFSDPNITKLFFKNIKKYS